jgi:ketosteroid isomerase-like protein
LFQASARRADTPDGTIAASAALAVRNNRRQRPFPLNRRKRTEAARAHVNGDSAPLERIVAQSGAATFFPPNGGSERGAKEVSARYDRDARAFGKGGETQLEILQSASGGDVGFWTGFQTAQVKLGDGSQPVKMKLRITELFRRMDGEWRMIHRHADPMAEPVKRDDSGPRGERHPQSGVPRGAQPRSSPH